MKEYLYNNKGTMIEINIINQGDDSHQTAIQLGAVYADGVQSFVSFPLNDSLSTLQRVSITIRDMTKRATQLAKIGSFLEAKEFVKTYGGVQGDIDERVEKLLNNLGMLHEPETVVPLLSDNQKIFMAENFNLLSVKHAHFDKYGNIMYDVWSTNDENEEKVEALTLDDLVTFAGNKLLDLPVTYWAELYDTVMETVGVKDNG